MAETEKQNENLDQFGGEAVEQLPEGNRTVAAFRQQLDKRDPELAVLLPTNVSKDRLKAVATEAVRQTPVLLQCDARSLMSAIGKAAKDGLMPDGREGVITPYREKQRDGSFRLVAQWNPMVGGLRKRARELNGIIVDSDVVHANDKFRFVGGNQPELYHERPPLGTDRGGIVGAFAIFRRGNEILHREVMDKNEIEKTRGQSKAPNSLMWTQFQGEAYRKSVVRRGFKTVTNLSERLEEIVRREDESFDFDQSEQRLVALPPIIEGKPEPEPEPARKPRKRGRPKGKGKAQAETTAADEAPAASTEPEPKRDKPAPTVLAVRTKMFQSPNVETLQAVWDTEVAPHDWSDRDMAALKKTYDERRGYKE